MLSSFIPEDEVAVIYQITNMVNGKYYIGSAESFARREWQHKYDLKRGAHKNPHLQASWNKYGADAFIFEVIEEIDPDRAAFDVENTYLMKCVGQPNCYNINSDAHKPRLGKTHSEETKARIRANRVAPKGENHYQYGKELSVEIREKIGAAQRGVPKAPRTYTPEGLERARESMKRNAKPQLPADFETVYAKFPAEVQDKYDFSNAVYTGALVRIENVFCEQHGIFSQYAARFRKGAGCPQCGAEKRAESKKAQMLAEWATDEGREKMLAARKKKNVDPNPDL
jgi:group I intron endonuclease